RLLEVCFLMRFFIEQYECKARDPALIRLDLIRLIRLSTTIRRLRELACPPRRSAETRILAFIRRERLLCQVISHFPGDLKDSRVFLAVISVVLEIRDDSHAVLGCG